MTLRAPVAGQLAAALIDQFHRGLPTEVRDHAVTCLLNVVGTAIGACREPAVEIVIASAVEHGGPARCPVPGRPERLDPLNAALATGLAAHLDDFDDTHLATVVHPSAAVLGAVMATLPGTGSTGAHLLDAFALGIEAQLRVALAMTPSHYEAGWHITSTVGPIGAAVTAGLLQGLAAPTLTNAIAIASSMTLGHRESFGTMVKPFHPGKAAANGVLAAGLARRGFTGSPTALEGPRGYYRALAPQVAAEQVTADLGRRWELRHNTVKPYPCGIVSHPAIEAAERLQVRLAGRKPVGVRIHGHPLVAELTGEPAPTTGLAARFSTVHGVAAALADGTVGPPQYAEARVNAPAVAAIRAVTSLVIDSTLARDAARVEVTVDDGTTLTESVAHARGSLTHPLTDADLHRKAEALIERTWPGRAAAVIAAVRGLATADGLTSSGACARFTTTITGATP